MADVDVDPDVDVKALLRRKSRKDSIIETNSFLDPNYYPKTLHGPSDVVDDDEVEQNDTNTAEDDCVHLEPYVLESCCPWLEIDKDKYTKVLVLYTGGTIGMKNVNGVGLAPVANYLPLVLRTLPMFHDKEYADELGIENQVDSPLIMPSSKEKKRVIYTVLEYNPLLDSSNITMTDWARLARDIKKHYDFYDGFLVLHGTDTMAYTASALSFMLENLGKPVIITGSQIPLYDTRSDGMDNFLGALTIAGHYNIPEVCICFHKKVMRGNRTIKNDSSGFDAFFSPNLPPLVQLEIDIQVNWNAVFKPVSLKRMDVTTKLCPSVGLLRFFPSITPQTVRQFLQPPMKGMVLQTYGAGNGPNSQVEILDIFREATERGVLIINITQCTKGKVTALYAAGKALLDVGVILGSDMTPEAALTKLAYVLGKEEWSLEKKRKMLGVNLRGEMKVMEEEISETKYVDLPLFEKMKQCMQISSLEEVELLRKNVYPPLMCAAAREGDIEAIKELMKAGCAVTSSDYDGRTPLHIACSEGHTETVHYLLENGALVHVKDRYGVTALDDAVQFTHLDIIELLYQTGANLVTIPKKLGIQLCLAAARNDLKKLKAYKLAGANLSQGDYDNRTALHVAVCSNMEDCVKFLLSNSVSITVEDTYGNTPENEAYRCKLEHIQMLFKEHKNNN